MDLNTVAELLPVADPDSWRPGDAWLAGGTVLFSYGSSTLRRLLDITSAGWAPLTVDDDGLEIAASCTIAELYEFADPSNPLHDEWPALGLVRQCCESFVASFKIWNVSTVGGNICTALPAGPMISLAAAMDGTALVLSPGGTRRTLPVTDLVLGDQQTALRPGELLRSIHLPATSLRGAAAFRRMSLTNLGRSSVLLIGRRDNGGTLTLTVTASTKRPHQLSFDGDPGAAMLRSMLDKRISSEDYHDDVHGHPLWRRKLTCLFAEEIRAELMQDGGTK